MENIDVKYRSIEKKDYKNLARIIKETWGYENYCSTKIADKMSLLYLYSCLGAQTFTEVAEIDGEAIGIVMAKSDEKYHISIQPLLNQCWTALQLMCYKEGRKIMRIFAGINKIDKELLDNCDEKFNGELCFFVLGERTRGLGIGKKLFNDAKNYMKSTNVKQFYLYTDSTCNYGFYEKQGLKRINEKIVEIDVQENIKTSFYIYSAEL